MHTEANLRIAAKPLMDQRFAAWLPILLGLVFSLAAWSAHATIETRSATLEAGEDGYSLSADFALELPRGLAEALKKGVPLYFVVEGELVRPRWYWSNERTGALTQTRRIAYNALTRQYQVGVVANNEVGSGSSGNALYQTVPSLEDALRFITRVSGLKLADKSDIHTGVQYQVWARLRFDSTQLPKPLQINAITNSDWKLESDWKKFPYLQPAPISATGEGGVKQ
jgi:hypothetical protein